MECAGCGFNAADKKSTPADLATRDSDAQRGGKMIGYLATVAEAVFVVSDIPAKTRRRIILHNHVSASGKKVSPSGGLAKQRHGY